ELTVWVGDDARPCRAGATAFAPGGSPHTWRVESDTARLLVLSTPAGIEDYFRALGEPAAWPWLQPPPDGPRVPAVRIEEVQRGRPLPARLLLARRAAMQHEHGRDLRLRHAVGLAPLPAPQAPG